MYIKRLFSTVIKCPTNYKCLPVCDCEIEFNKIIKDLNITIVTLSTKQKDDVKEDDKDKKQIPNNDRCD